MGMAVDTECVGKISGELSGALLARHVCWLERGRQWELFCFLVLGVMLYTLARNDLGALGVEGDLPRKSPIIACFIHRV